MKVQWENKVMSSLMMYLDNVICDTGEGYTNHSGPFYKTLKKFNQFHSYSLPYKQIVSDTSVYGANVMQGVSVNGDFKSIGESGLSGIMHHKGTLLFTEDHDADTITGNFAVKEYNIYITTKSEENLLFKTAKQINPKIQQVESGLDPHTEAYPAIFLKNMGGKQDPLGFGMVKDTVSYIRAVVLSDSAFSLDAVCGILKRTSKEMVSVIDSLPFNAVGAYDGTPFDYKNLTLSAGTNFMIWNVTVSKIMPQTAGMNDLNLDVFAAFVDFEIRSLGH